MLASLCISVISLVKIPKIILVPKTKTVPFKLGKNICNDHSALQRSVCDGVVLKEGKQVLAVLHGQTSDELLHNLPQQHKIAV